MIDEKMIVSDQKEFNRWVENISVAYGKSIDQILELAIVKQEGKIYNASESV